MQTINNKSLAILGGGLLAMGFGVGMYVYFRDKWKTSQGDKIPADKHLVIATSKFPLIKGTKSDEVKTLQEALIKLGAKFPATGYFWDLTESDLRKRGYTIPLPEDQFNEIVSKANQPKSTYLKRAA